MRSLPSGAAPRTSQLYAPGHGDLTGPFWAAWPVEPVLLLGLVGGAALYWFGWSHLSRVAGADAVSSPRAASFLGGMVAVGLALLSPIAVYSERLFFMHMIQHLLLLLRRSCCWVIRLCPCCGGCQAGCGAGWDAS